MEAGTATEAAIEAPRYSIVATLMEDSPANLPQASPFEGAVPWDLRDNTFDDAHSWNQPQYGTTMMFADINGDGRADVCGRGLAGIYCELSTGFGGFGALFLAHGAFSDANG